MGKNDSNSHRRLTPSKLPDKKVQPRPHASLSDRIWAVGQGDSSAVIEALTGRVFHGHR